MADGHLAFVTDEELVERMGGEYPPSDIAQKDAYFEIAHARLCEAYGEEWARSSQFLAGLAPDLLWDHWRDLQAWRRQHGGINI